MVEPHRSNFRVITTNCLGVRIFRKFTVIIRKLKQRGLPKSIRVIHVCPKDSDRMANSVDPDHMASPPEAI